MNLTYVGILHFTTAVVQLYSSKELEGKKFISVNISPHSQQRSTLVFFLLFKLIVKEEFLSLVVTIDPFCFPFCSDDYSS